MFTVDWIKMNARCRNGRYVVVIFVSDNPEQQQRGNAPLAVRQLRKQSLCNSFRFLNCTSALFHELKYPYGRRNIETVKNNEGKCYLLSR